MNNSPRCSICTRAVLRMIVSLLAAKLPCTLEFFLVDVDGLSCRDELDCFSVGFFEKVEDISVVLYLVSELSAIELPICSRP